jgi:SAM-dependent methyltransferase
LSNAGGGEETVGLLGGSLGYQLLRWISKDGETGYCDGSVYAGKSKLEVLLGPNIWVEFENRVVIDFGCGSGTDAIEIAKRGAKEVIGLDIRESALREARDAAQRENVDSICTFQTDTNLKSDVILSVDSFEHFSNPQQVLSTMRGLLKDDGSIIAVFGPTWFHPLGGHLFSVFPWAHLLFTEKALIRWRSDFKSDAATRFSEVEGGLNQMTIRRFVALVERSAFTIRSLEAVPIRRLQSFSNRFTREFTTAIVRCRLVPRE